MNKLLPKIWYQKRGLIWLCLWPLSLLYRVVIYIRKVSYKMGLFKTYRIPCKVIVVGNLTVGGAGKTLMVKALVPYLLEQGYQVGVICKGYKGSLTAKPILVSSSSTAKEVGDEAIELHHSLSVPVVAAKNRVAGARFLYAHMKPDIIISDDGLAHDALYRNLDIILQKEGVGLGNKSLLPAGPLRTPIKPLQKIK